MGPSPGDEQPDLSDSLGNAGANSLPGLLGLPSGRVCIDVTFGPRLPGLRYRIFAGVPCPLKNFNHLIVSGKSLSQKVVATYDEVRLTAESLLGAPKSVSFSAFNVHLDPQGSRYGYNLYERVQRNDSDASSLIAIH